MAAGAAGAADGMFRSIYRGCISGCAAAMERRPYHKNSSGGCNHHSCSSYVAVVRPSRRCRGVSYPIRRSWSEGSLALRLSASPSSSLSSSPALGVAESDASHQLRRFIEEEDDNSNLSVQDGIVALGKFDALHIGHRELAIQAARVGAPYLLSFVGMAEVLGWEPRAPIVAKCDRKRVLSSWASYCGNVAPIEFQIEFSSVRHLSPQQFVEKLAKELRVHGVVAGENYRFGYRASGDASELVRLCEEYGIKAYIINSVMDKNQDNKVTDKSDRKEQGQVSSTQVRHALAVGDMNYVAELLGRPHRLILRVRDEDMLSGISCSRWKLSVCKSCLLNLPPMEGLYDECSLLVGDDNPISCRVLIDTTHVRLDVNEVDVCNLDGAQGFQLLGIEFGKLS